MFRNNSQMLLTVLIVVFAASLAASTSQNPTFQLLPIGGLWAFVAGALPFLASDRFPVIRFALLLGIIFLVAGLMAAIATGDSLFARA